MANRRRLSIAPRRGLGVAVAIVAIASASLPAAAAASGWSIQSTPILNGPPRGVLGGVSCTASANCIAVGSYTNKSGVSMPLAERWNGTAWTIKTPAGKGTLSSVSCSGAIACIAVGSSGASALAEQWNGTAWTIENVPAPSGAQSTSLSGVSCTSAAACTAVGSYVDGSGSRQPLAEFWNGSAWAIQVTSGISGGGLSRVSCSSANACTAIRPASGMVARWDGTAWSNQTVTIPAGATSTQLYGVSCTGADTCVVVGHWIAIHCNNGQPTCNCLQSPGCTIKQSTLAEQWNGSSWVIETTPGTGYLSDVSCTTTTCTAVGYLNNTTLVEQWDGSTWAIQGSPTPTGGRRLSSVSCVAVNACTATGQGNGATLAEGWDGIGWTTHATPNPPGPASPALSGVSCDTTSACTAVGSYTNTAGTLVSLAEYSRSGAWTTQAARSPAGATASSLSAVACASASACTATGAYYIGGGNPPPDSALAEGWNGTSWALEATPSPGAGYDTALTGVSCPAATDCIAAGYDYFNQGPQNSVLAEQWNGTAWSIMPAAVPAGAYSSSLVAVSCVSATDCEAVGWWNNNGVIEPLAEQWNGSAWTIQATPGTGTLRAVSCAAANACTAIGDSGGAMLVERWDGSAWTIQSVPGTGTLAGVSCAAANACTAVGNSAGVVLVEHWDGSAWATQAAPSPAGAGSSSFSAVSCTTATVCAAVGQYQNSAGALMTLAERYAG